MPNGLTQRAEGEPQPAFQESSKRDLTSWWRNFKKGAKRDEEKGAPLPGIFGVPLQTSVRYANVAISLQDAEGKSYVYGYVPIVVAKCGVFLKEKATDVEGIFRLSGSEKRIKELREAFNSPDRFGKGLDWTGYTVHDAANILRRYFNQLPEPIIPLEFYERFRDPIRNHQSDAVGPMDGQSPSVGDFDAGATIRIYQNLITELPPLNRQLLLYILDLLAVFASKSDLNKMTTQNLSAIFQPGILSHPSHDMAPPEYRLSQDVLIFLIENQDHFLIGMQGTAADEKTVQEVESGPPTPAASRPSRSMVGRSSSNASKYSGVRRSVSVSSRQSRNSVTHSPMSPSFHGTNSPLNTPTTGVHRSNTVPSNRSPMTPHGGRFQRDLPSHSPSPGVTPGVTPGETPMYTPAEMPGAYPFNTDSSRMGNASAQRAPATPEVVSPSSSEGVTPIISPPTASRQPITPTHDFKREIPTQYQKEIKPNTSPIHIPQSLSGSAEHETPPSATPSAPRSFTAIFGSKNPTSDSIDGERKPKKLQKKRMPGSVNPSANSSTQSLGGSASATAAATAAEDASIAPSTASHAPLLSAQQTPTQQQTFLYPPSADTTPIKLPPSLATQPPMSPAHSYRSHSEFTEGELDSVEQLDHNPSSAALGLSGSEATDIAEKERKRNFWGSRKKGESVSHGGGAYNLANPTAQEAQRSRSSVLSGSEKEKERERKSMTMDRSAVLSVTSDPDERDGRKSWIGRKLEERAHKKEEKERLKDEAKRAKSPPPQGHSDLRGTAVPGSGSMQSLTAATASSAHAPSQPQSGLNPNPDSISAPINIPPRGKSLDFARRDGGRRSMDVAPLPGSSPLASPSHFAKRSTDGGSRERQRSLLDIGEDAVVAKQASNSGTSMPQPGSAS